MIQLKNINKYYRTENVETRALNDINLDIQAGDFVAIIGPSGCGKSTLLNVLGMLDDINEGQYIFDGVDVSKLPEHKLAQARLGKIGFIFQSFHSIDELSVAENIEVPLLYNKVNRSSRKKRVQAVLEQMNIAHRAKHKPKQLSGGQQQRVAIARALVTEPKLMLADEPTGNLDSKHGDEVMQLLESMNARGTTVVMVTHSDHHASFAHRIVRLFDGEVMQSEQKTNRHEEALS